MDRFLAFASTSRFSAFPILSYTFLIDLDYNASTPIDFRVLDFMVDVYKNNVGNADSRTHDSGESSCKVVENAREQVATLLDIRKDEVFY